MNLQNTSVQFKDYRICFQIVQGFFQNLDVALSELSGYFLET